MKSRTAFTLTELIIVVILLGIIVGFALPNYSKSLERAAEKDAAFNLAHIGEAIPMWRSITQTTDVGVWDLPDINNQLNLGIIANDNLTYSCTPGPVVADTNVCTAAYGGTWSLHIHDGEPEPHCASGTCPTCTDSTASGCSHYFN
ncbi:MAG: prepilin-type N-terminal cleavage/methylation domain-containing protein [Candidatus Omnitrophica bacterium]|nr:prepilin-type N-terminal cleavage/methylation domain-containing protein [Candidatus Omnitrophota bacterium]